MAITKISELTAAIKTGARSNMFQVELSKLGGSEAAQQISNWTYLCKGAQLPSSTLGLVEVPFMAGRRFKIAGDRTFPEWTTTVLNDTNQKVRQALEELQIQYGVTDYESEQAKTSPGAENTEFQTIIVRQFDYGGNEIYAYTLYNAWPSDISTIDLSYDSTDTVEEFTVTWSYDYFTLGAETGVGVDDDATN